MNWNKFRAVKTTIDGITFDSKKEANYYLQLKLLMRGHVVTKFEQQVTYELQPGYVYQGKKIRPIRYIADFVVTYADGHTEVVDVKGVRTKEYLLKRKILLYQNPTMDFKEV